MVVPRRILPFSFGSCHKPEPPSLLCASAKMPVRSRTRSMEHTAHPRSALVEVEGAEVVGRSAVA